MKTKGVSSYEVLKVHFSQMVLKVASVTELLIGIVKYLVSTILQDQYIYYCVSHRYL